MKHAGILGLAIVLAMSVAAGTTQANKKVKKVATEVTIDDLHGDDLGDPGYVGHVSSKKSRCLGKRTVILHRVFEGEDEVQGSTTTDNSGQWQVDHGGIIEIADYYAVAEKRKIKKKHNRKLVCKEGVSPVFDIPF